MTNIFKSHKLYKLIVIVFLVIAISNIKNQLMTLRTYNREISALNDKIATLQEQIDTNNTNSEISKEDNENMARKNLRMYYPNETPYKGY